ncbi:MAG: glycosyltransferase family 2 protein [Sulfobacillus benefaciens]|uniref:Glycosyltransferase family 2 protein n=1 Tax=Sulfobacillus benefaciens TaxID=453960 RepID=A0A2T2X8C2_9FIRM|nr:MAG: glycosyltransferase family 2 protein [Sulfobacillus benefaciens]HBQ96483.1 glycosyltransferase family 2 protein [Sulfobacillus sp.]
MTGVTIVVPVYYGRDYLKRCLESVRQQEKVPLPIQLIALEDGTPEPYSSEDIASHYHAEYHYITHNQGVAQARRLGASLSVFDDGFLAFLDQDDYWYPTFLTTMIEALTAHPRSGFAVSNAHIVFPEGTKYQLYQTKVPSLRLKDLKMFNHIVTPSQVLMRLNNFRRTNWTGQLSTPGADDWLLWLSLTRHGFPGIFVPLTLMAYLEHDGGAHQNIPKMRQSEASVVEEWFPKLGFSRWDQRRYWAGVNIERSLHYAYAKNWRQFFRVLSDTTIKDPPASLSAAWYRVERKLRHWV